MFIATCLVTTDPLRVFIPSPKTHSTPKVGTGKFQLGSNLEGGQILNIRPVISSMSHLFGSQDGSIRPVSIYDSNPTANGRVPGLLYS